LELYYTFTLGFHDEKTLSLSRWKALLGGFPSPRLSAFLTYQKPCLRREASNCQVITAFTRFVYCLVRTFNPVGAMLIPYLWAGIIVYLSTVTPYQAVVNGD